MKRFLVTAILVASFTASLSSCGALWRTLTSESVADTSLVGTTWEGKLGSSTYSITFFTSVGLNFTSSTGLVDATTGKPKNSTVTPMTYTYTQPNIVLTDPEGVSTPMQGVVEGDKMTFGSLVFTKQQKQ